MRKDTVVIDHARYLAERSYRREVLLQMRRLARKTSSHRVDFQHEAGEGCCRREAPEITMAHLVHQLGLDSIPAWAAGSPSGWLPTPAVAKPRPGGRVSAKLAELEAEFRRSPRRCEHLSAGSQQPAFMRIDDGKALCDDCLRAWAETVAGTAEDHTCDICRREDKTVTSVLTRLALPGQLSLYYGICSGCRAAEFIEQ
jgi:hypothetical protein